MRRGKGAKIPTGLLSTSLAPLKSDYHVTVTRTTVDAALGDNQLDRHVPFATPKSIDARLPSSSSFHASLVSFTHPSLYPFPFLRPRSHPSPVLVVQHALQAFVQLQAVRRISRSLDPGGLLCFRAYSGRRARPCITGNGHWPDALQELFNGLDFLCRIPGGNGR